MLWRGADGLLRGLAGGLERSSGSGVDDAKFVADFFDFALQSADGGVAGAVEGLELGGDVVAVDGEFVGNGDKLSEERPSGNEKQRGEGKDDEQGGRGTRKTKTLEQGDDGGEEKCEQDGDSKRKEKDFGEVEDCDRKYSDGDEPELRQKACGR